MDVAPTAIIPCRAGSEGAPGKNMRPLFGRALYLHAVDHARAAGIERILVSTDIAEILAAPEPGLTVVRRPAALAGGGVPMNEVLLDLLDRDPALDGPLVLLQPTSPLRRAAHILGALEVWRAGEVDLVMTVAETDRGLLKCGLVEDGVYRPLGRADQVFANRQALPAVYRPTGAVYVFGAAWLREQRSLAAGRIGVFPMTAEEAFDIDTPADFERCEAALRQRGQA